MDIIIKDNYLDMSKCAAQIIGELVKNKPSCVLGLATGGTPIGTYRELIKLHNQGLDFSKVKTFNLDEYLGIGKKLSKSYEMDQSYARFMQEELINHLNIKPENVHVPDGLTKNPEQFCQWYEDEIKKAGGIDLQLLGIGGDGHWAFNEPGSPLTSRTRVEKLTEQTLDDNYEAFYKAAGISKSDMPHFALTMGIGTILEAKSLIMLANGHKKAAIVAKALEGNITTDVTASAIQLFKGTSYVILDQEAASKLSKLQKNSSFSNVV